MSGARNMRAPIPASAVFRATIAIAAATDAASACGGVRVLGNRVYVFVWSAGTPAGRAAASAPDAADTAPHPTP